MVLVRTLLSAPNALTTLSSPTRQLVLSQLRFSTLLSFSPVRGNLKGAALGDVEFRWYSGRLTLKECGLQRSSLTNLRSVWFPRRRPSDSNGHREAGASAPQLRVQCFSTPASSKGVSIRFPVTLEENTAIESSALAAVDQIKIDGELVLGMVAKRFEDMETTETVELSLLLCDDPFIQELNSKWLGKDSPTDVLSFPQDQEPGLTPHLLLGDVIISLDTAAKQAAERGHTLLDEMRILLVHGLLHVLGYDHELGPEDSQEMEAKETELLSELGWKGKGLITSVALEDPPTNKDVAVSESLDEPARKPSTKPPFKVLFCDMDGTLLNERSRVTDATADALRAAMARGVQVIIATGKTQYGAMAALKPVGLTGEGGVVSSTTPGVFTQGLQVYGRGGGVLYSARLDANVVKDAFDYSMEHNLPTVGFSANRVVTLFRHPFTDALHELYLEPKAEVIPSLDTLMAACPIQKLIFYDTPESIKYKIRPYWAAKCEGKVTLVQALDDMLEMLPPGQSKGAGVTMLLDHLGVPAEEVMAIGDGENDIGMLRLAGWGVAMANGSDATKAVANAVTGSNNEDGAAQAIHKYILS